MEKDTLRMQFLSGVITESEYKAIINKEIEDAKKDSLNESMIGGIVGIGAINQIPSRAKADYETAFEHFLGEKYGLNEVEIEEVEEVEELEEDFKFGGKHGLTMAGDEPTPVKVNKGNKELGGIASTMEDVFQAFTKEVQQKYPDIFQDKKLLSRIEMMAQQIKRLKNEVKVEEIKEVEETNNY